MIWFFNRKHLFFCGIVGFEIDMVYDIQNFSKLEDNKEYHDFESEIVDQKDEATMRRIGGKGLKEFWCDLYKYRLGNTKITK